MHSFLHMRTTFPAHPILLDLFFLIVFGDDYRLCYNPLWNFLHLLIFNLSLVQIFSSAKLAHIRLKLQSEIVAGINTIVNLEHKINYKTIYVNMHYFILQKLTMSKIPDFNIFEVLER
jgi:hypothetical protein